MFVCSVTTSKYPHRECVGRASLSKRFNSLSHSGIWLVPPTHCIYFCIDVAWKDVDARVTTVHEDGSVWKDYKRLNWFSINEALHWTGTLTLLYLIVLTHSTLEPHSITIERRFFLLLSITFEYNFYYLFKDHKAAFNIVANVIHAMYGSIKKPAKAKTR